MGGLIEHNVSGYVIPKRNSNALRDAFQGLLDDEQLRKRFSESAQKTIATTDQEHMFSGYRQVIEYVIGRNNRKLSQQCGG